MLTKKIEDKRSKIMRISKHLFKEHGYFSTTIKMITDEMKFKNQASFYRYFNNKEEIGVLIIRDFTARVINYMENEMLIKDNPLLRLVIHELFVYNLILTDFTAGRFVYEQNKITVYPANVMLNTEYAELIKETIKQSLPLLPRSMLMPSLIFFTSGFAGLYMSIIENQKQENVPKFSESLNLLLALLQIDTALRAELYHQAIALYDAIPKEKLKDFALLD